MYITLLLGITAAYFGILAFHAWQYCLASLPPHLYLYPVACICSPRPPSYNDGSQHIKCSSRTLCRRAAHTRLSPLASGWRSRVGHDDASLDLGCSGCDRGSLIVPLCAPSSLLVSPHCQNDGHPTHILSGPLVTRGSLARVCFGVLSGAPQL